MEGKGGGGLTTSCYLLSTMVEVKLYHYHYLKKASVWIKILHGIFTGGTNWPKHDVLFHMTCLSINRAEFLKTICPNCKTNRKSKCPITFGLLPVRATGKFHFYNPDFFCFSALFLAFSHNL